MGFGSFAGSLASLHLAFVGLRLLGLFNFFFCLGFVGLLSFNLSFSSGLKQNYYTQMNYWNTKKANNLDLIFIFPSELMAV
ncbi:MAG: hypothetical protein Ct9H90mP5_03990 [Acidimicrobiaceae bacterium]|nr:MAG: hypothetical protein Ct9H90mP5_03990 [Acidimicrobiaceae bacterium]